jgi:small subunit ribosomal protein S9
VSDAYYAGVGRRKGAVARVRLYPGGENHQVNDKPLAQVFPSVRHQTVILRPLRATDALGKYRVQAKVAGGGVTSWADAIALGVSRALLAADETVRKPLRKQGLLTRDARVKERKKYGLKRARKAPQFTKR